MPLSLVDNGLDDLIVERLGLKAEPLDIGDWRELLDRDPEPRPRGDRSPSSASTSSTTTPTSRSTSRSTTPASPTGRAVIVRRVEAEEVERRAGRSGAGRASTACSCPAASACAASRARSRRSATRGRTTSRSSASAWACSARSIEFARNVLGLEDANSTEFDQHDAAPGGLPAGRAGDASRQRGGTMRLGACARAASRPSSLARQAYGARADPASGTGTATSSTTTTASSSRSTAWS